MIFAPIDPMSSRPYLKKRSFESWVVLAGVFLSLAILLSWVISSLRFTTFIPYLVGDIIAGLIAYYAYLVWNEQPMRIRCNECGEAVLCRTPWICGECGHENWDVKRFPFVNQCANCHLPPKSYICHHCQNPLFLSEDRDATNPARRVNTQGRVPKERVHMKEEVERKYEEKKQDIESAKLDLTEAQIKAQIKSVKKGVPGTSLKSALDILWESLCGFMETKTAAREVVRRQKLINAEQCKKDPSERRRRDLEVDEWARKHFSDETENPHSQ